MTTRVTIAQVRQAREARPFRPFVLRLADEREVVVLRPEFLACSPSGHTVVVYQPGDWFDVLDLLQVRALVPGDG